MINRKLIQIICLLCVFACLISLLGCLKEETNDTQEKINDIIATYPETTHYNAFYGIDDFKCVCSSDDETEFVIENDNAKKLYTYITDQWNAAEKTHFDRAEQDYIYLSFQDGDPLLLLNQESKEVTLDNFAKSDRYFYGVFQIYDNDYMVYTAMPMTSFQEYYKLPAGTYDKITELINKK